MSTNGPMPKDDTGGGSPKTDFSSDKIKSMDGAKLFMNVSDKDANERKANLMAEQHKKEIEKARKNFQSNLEKQKQLASKGEKERARLEERSRIAREKQLAKAKKKEKFHKTKFYGIFIKGWRKFATLIVAVILFIVTPVCVYSFVIKPEIARKKAEEEAIAKEQEAQQYREEKSSISYKRDDVAAKVKEILDSDDGDKLDNAKKLYKEAIENSEGNEHYGMILGYASFLVYSTLDYAEAEEQLNELDIENLDEDDGMDMLVLYRTLYEKTGNDEKAAEYQQKIKDFSASIITDENPCEGLTPEECALQ